uniref:A-kinase anchor protein 14-like n=1 Tax=Phallusia mammillata TaxID=59560 RepID=A0A6F9D6Z0_9ASCI|nr:A-kinase anchor protein 14-like [Phallusia mammillata]
MAQQYWQSRRQRRIVVMTNLDERNQRVATAWENRLLPAQQQCRDFFQRANLQHTAHNPSLQSISQKLTSWAKDGAWRYCNSCYSLLPCQLSPSCSLPRPTTPSDCPCKSSTYSVPRHNQWPSELLCLTAEDARHLSLYEVHVGNTRKAQHGYRCKDGIFRLTLKSTSPQHNIESVSDPIRKAALRRAYDWLMACTNSEYSNFVQKLQRNELVKKPNISVICNEKYLECAIWPVLYWNREWCESSIHNATSHASMKKAFCVKAMSSIMDYGQHFELIRFNYDRWLFKTFTGAIDTSKKYGCSPARALDSKHFSPTYWQWQHCYLIDCTAQFGLPDVFITISPYEWTFPQSSWLEEGMASFGSDPTDLAFWETRHIAHILEQFIRGYICGKTKYNWRNPILGHNNVISYFYRFEFQQRGTLHVHLIAWLKDRTKIDMARIKSTITANDEDLAKFVYRHQKSDKSAQGLIVSEEPNHFDNANRFIPRRLQIDQELNIRTYIDSILISLQSSMDLQMGNSQALLLNYVAGYVAKHQDSFFTVSSLLTHFDSHSMAVRYMKTMTPSEPEMTLALEGTQLAYTSSRTKNTCGPYHPPAPIPARFLPIIYHEHLKTTTQPYCSLCAKTTLQTRQSNLTRTTKKL